MPVIPVPRSFESRSGSFRLADASCIQVEDPRLLPIAKLLKTSLQPLALPVSRRRKKASVSLRLVDGLVKEAYRLRVGLDGVAIEAGDQSGIFYGIQTLIQLLRDGEVPCIEVEDAPRFQWRGLMLDSSRHFQSVETIKKILDQMALLKLNKLHWHLTDDPGWRIEIKQYPKLHRITQLRPQDEPGGRGYYTQRQIRELVAYAAAHQIDIVPEIEIPAHTTAAMAAYPELTCTGEAVPITGVGIHTFTHSTGKRIYCASKPECLEFLSNVFDEVCDLFPAPVIHVGGDERPEGIWTDCPRCRETMEREGLPSEAALQRWFMGKVAELVRSKGRRTMAWTPTVEFGVPEGEIVQDWHFGVIPGALSLGAEVVNSRDRFTYFDYPNAPGRQKPTWMPDLSYETVYQFDPDSDGPVLGAECSLWTEMISEEDIEEALFPRLQAFAEVVWSPKDKRDLASFKKRLSQADRVGHLDIASLPVLPRAVASTSMEAAPTFGADHAFDGKFTRYFWSEEPPVAGDHLTLVFDAPLPIKGIRLYTGCDIAKDDILESGAIEVSEDGESFDQKARVAGPFAEVWEIERPIKAIRISVAEPMSHRLAISEIVVDSQ